MKIKQLKEGTIIFAPKKQKWGQYIENKEGKIVYEKGAYSYVRLGSLMYHVAKDIEVRKIKDNVYELNKW